MEVKEVKTSQDEIKNAITELQSQIDATAARVDEAEQRIRDTENKIIENNEAQKKRYIKAKEHDLRIREFSDSLNRNIRIIGVPEDEEREKRVEELCEQIIAENFPNLGKTQTSKSRKHRELPSNSTKANHHQGISQSNSQNTQTRKEARKHQGRKSP